MSDPVYIERLNHRDIMDKGQCFTIARTDQGRVLFNKIRNEFPAHRLGTGNHEAVDVEEPEQLRD